MTVAPAHLISYPRSDKCTWANKPLLPRTPGLATECIPRTAGSRGTACAHQASQPPTAGCLHRGSAPIWGLTNETEAGSSHCGRGRAVEVRQPGRESLRQHMVPHAPLAPTPHPTPTPTPTTCRHLRGRHRHLLVPSRDQVRQAGPADDGGQRALGPACEGRPHHAGLQPQE
jgi:hypothetical protein